MPPLETRERDPYWAREHQLTSAERAALKEVWRHAGRKVWAAATRAGENVQARTEHELEALDRSHLEQSGVDPFFQTGVALPLFVRGRNQSRQANVVGADKYFHCKANCEPARNGPGGATAAMILSGLREAADPKNWLDGGADRRADHAANRYGRAVARSEPGRACSAACAGFRPKALPSKY